MGLVFDNFLAMTLGDLRSNCEVEAGKSDCHVACDLRKILDNPTVKMLAWKTCLYEIEESTAIHFAGKK